MIQKFRKKPVVIEAIQWTNDPGNFTELLEWSKGKVAFASPLVWEQTLGVGNFPSFSIEVKTGKGVVLVELKDWVIKNENGEFYPCKPDIFEKTYEPVTDNTVEDGK